MSYAIAISRYYDDLATRLLDGAQRALAEHGGGEGEVFDVAGAFELPLGALYLAETGRYRGVVCLGTVIRGETDHYDYVCNEASRGILEVSLRTGVPCGFGVLTVDTLEQALARTGDGKRHQGYDAAAAVATMAGLRERVG